MMAHYVTVLMINTTLFSYIADVASLFMTQGTPNIKMVDLPKPMLFIYKILW